MVGPRSFPSRIRHIQTNDPVTAPIASAPDKVLEGRTNYLKARLDDIEAGRALLWVDQVLAPEVLEGQPVFWNSETNRWEQGLAGVEDCNDAAALATLPSSDVQGIVLRKRVGNIGDIALWGVVYFTDQLANAIDGTIEPGNYYLSAEEPGKMVKQRPPVSVLCCHVFGPLNACDQNTWVYVRPMQKDFLEDHIHFSYDLVARPAGVTVPPLPGERHEITDPDETLPGWLPADHAVFNGFAPTGAIFGYNLSAHEAVDRNWPPIPACASLLEMFKPALVMHEEPAGVVARPQLVGGTVPKTTVVIDKHGIWWMTNCYGEVPWPTDLNTSSQSSSSSEVSSLSTESVSSSSSSAPSQSSSSSEGPPCPQDLPMTLTLYFIKMTFLGQKTVVTSLQPDTGQPFKFVNCEGLEASTGELFAQLVLALLIVDEFYGGQVLKGISAENKFERGWVTEGLIAGAGVALTSTHQRRLTPGESSTPLVHQGIITVTTATESEKELNPQIVVLGDALERDYKDINYLALPNGKDSGITLKFSIPPAGLPNTPRLKIRLQLFGKALSGTLTDLTTTWKRIPRPTSGSPVPIVAGMTAFTMATNITVVADEINEVESELLTVEAGDTVYVTIEREAAGTPAFAAEIGLHRYGGVLVDGS